MGGPAQLRPRPQPRGRADPSLTGFIGLAGQGGFGIMTSPAMSRAAAALAAGGAWPEDFGDRGIEAAALAPGQAGAGGLGSERSEICTVRFGVPYGRSAALKPN